VIFEAEAASDQPKAARASFRTATGLDPNKADRAAVNACCADWEPYRRCRLRDERIGP